MASLPKLAIDELFEAVRAAAPADAWSSGVTLARRGHVSLDASDGEEIVARVAVAGAPITPTVSLFPEEIEWECDCTSPHEACEHVAASLIALKQGGGSESPSDSAGPSGVAPKPLEYRLTSGTAGLSLERGVVDEDGRFHPIVMRLAALAAGRFDGPPVDATKDDLAIESALAGRLTGALERQGIPRILRALARARRVLLDGDPVRASGEPVLPAVRVDDAPGGFRLSLAPSPDVERELGGVVALVGDVLRPVGEPQLSGRERHELTSGRVFRADEVGHLMGEVLPSLERRLPLDVRTNKLPRGSRERPLISFRTRRQGDGLYVLPRVVYGDPPRARVEGERLVSLGGDVPRRDLEAERALEERLRNEFGLLLGEGTELETEAAIELATKLARFRGHLEGRDHEAFRLHDELQPSVAIEESDFDVSFRSGAKRAEPRAVLRAFREGASLVPLTDGGFAPLPADWLGRFGRALSDLLAAREGREALPPSSLPDLGRLAEELELPPPPGLEKLRALLPEGARALPDPSVAPSLWNQLRDYQREGVRWLSFLKSTGMGALLADDMGLGKTLQALTVLEGRSLVAAPTSVLENWVAEARRFRPDLTLCLYHGPSRTLDPEADVTITSHALVRLDQDVLGAERWDTVVVDEAQAIRNPDTELARAAHALDARFRVSLTGTPIENRLLDLWSQLHFLNPGLLGTRSDFEERYVRPAERGDADVLDHLRARVRPFFLRRLKSEVAPELPPRTELTLRADLSPEERELYEAVRLSVRNDVLEKLDAGGSPLAVLEGLLRLRQAACHPALVPGQRAESSSKTELLLRTLETAASEDHKSLVFSQWTGMLDLLEPHLERQGLGYARLDGGTTDRGGVVRRFQDDPDVAVFLISLKAGGTGLNLTAADHVFLFDPWWNPAVEQQAFDRAHRIGQDKPVFVHRLVAADTVEERILELQEEKRSLSELATGGASAPLTRDDLRALVE